MYFFSSSMIRSSSRSRLCWSLVTCLEKKGFWGSNEVEVEAGIMGKRVFGVTRYIINLGLINTNTYNNKHSS